MPYTKNETYKAYNQTRFTYDVRRQMVWNAIMGYLEKLLGKPNAILDLGAGYCTAVNASSASRKYACDMMPDFSKYAGPRVHTHVGSCTRLEWLPPEERLDWVIASNLFEHLDRNDLAACLSALLEKMHNSGLLIVIQPNFRLCYKAYFDDYTHLPESIFTETSMADYLNAHGFDPVIQYRRFLPFSMKSPYPVSRILVSAYLRSPLKPFAGQMLVVAKPARKIE